MPLLIVKSLYEKFESLILELYSNPLSRMGLIIITGFILIAVAAPLLAPPNYPDPYKIPKVYSSEPLPPSSKHPFGTSGPPGYYDIYYGVIWGTRISLRISLIVVGVAVAIGVVVGSISAYFGGIIDNILMRITEVFLSLPGLILAMAIASMMERSLQNMILALIAVWWPAYARIVRAEVLRVKNEPYVEAAKILGLNTYRIIARHILPNSIYTVLVIASMDLGLVVLVASGLGFLGLGAQPGTAEWGIMISEGRNWLLQGAWWPVFFPGIAIFLWVLGWSLLGDGLRDVLDPRTRKRGVLV
ncbi:ABC transporter, permease protein [Aeropyrum pernix K1]|uniref:ABC transporter, permease protein n=1 Tax=Aeropyrum pernix (strain ATCC 700893 / DSM 11879 / JCM 9820 / NBRC 100138 / K1) TaxID=272557 RepID=Q9YFD9_AERPE|nr:ABC transporter, permease protein [Aeropyrum pernix K1]